MTNDKTKSIGWLLLGLGVFLIGLASLIYVLRGCAQEQSSANADIPSEADFQQVVENAKKALNDPELQEAMRKNIKKALTEAEVKKVKTETRIIKP